MRAIKFEMRNMFWYHPMKTRLQTTGDRERMEAALTGLPEVQALLVDNGMSVERMVETLYHHNLGSRFLEMQVQESQELRGLVDTLSPSSLIYGDKEGRLFRSQALF